MQVEILKHPTEEDWMLCKKCALVTVSKKAVTAPTLEWKTKMLKANHSPVRALNFCFEIKDIPYWVAGHLVRHVHATPYVKTQRDDRQNQYKRGKAPQDTPVSMCWYMNAEELITIAHKRLCAMAAKETREVVQMICDAVIKTNPEFKGILVPLCEYRGGLCDEFNCCGRNKEFLNKSV